MKNYKINTNSIAEEIKNSLLKIPTKQTENLINQIIKANRVYLVAIGRVNLSLQCFGKRLSHLGIKVELVGSLTEKPASKKDLLIVASGSGESLIPVQISKKARSETNIGLNSLSVSGLALKLVRNIFENPNEQNVLVVGAGSLAQNVIESLYKNGINKIKSVNRTIRKINWYRAIKIK